MKHLKKAFALVLALAMVLSFGMLTAFAEGEATATGPYTITMKTTAGHTYAAYQVFKGDLSESTLSNVEWGDNVDGTALLAALKADQNYKDSFKDCTTAADVANVLSTFKEENKANDVKALSKIIYANKKGTGKKSEISGEGENATIKITGLYAGYYMILDETAADSMPEGETYSDIMLNVVKDVTVTAKDGKSESEKHVDDQNDSNADDKSVLKDSADYDIGDKVPYTLTYKLPDDYANYTKFAVDFYDDMSEGLTYNGDAKIYYGSNDTTGADITFTADNTKTSAYTNGTVYKASIDNLKAVDAAKNLKAGDTITIKYTATLNGKAVIGYAGNPNRYQVEFSNNPNVDTSKGTTPWDKNIVFTYKVVFNKLDENKQALEGADFTLYKFVVSEGGKDTYGEGENAVNGTWTDVTALNSGSNATNPSKTTNATEAEGTEGEDGYVAAKEATTFEFKGLDAGVYKLSETKTPAGYNSIADVVFTISANHELDADNPKLTKLEAEGLSMTASKDSDNNFTGELKSDIENQKGSELPETGGIGTVIFYVLGAALVIGCGIVLVSRRRVSDK